MADVVEEDVLKPAGAAKTEIKEDEEQVKEDGKGEGGSSPAMDKSVSFKEESSFLFDLKEQEKKALEELRTKLNDSTNKEEEGGGGVSLWGVRLELGEAGDGATEVVLLKFLRAREFKVEEAAEMFRKTVKWRKEKGIEGILEEEIAGGGELKTVCYISGSSREGRPVCYNVHGGEVYNGMVGGREEEKERLMRWRIQRVEEGIRKLDFRPGGVSSFVQINDLNNTLGFTKKELRVAIKHAVDMLQDNYPELVARNIFINVPFWYYAFSTLQSQFLTQRTRSKFVFARPARVTETLLKYIGGEEIPVQYGGLKREGDEEFEVEYKADEVVVKAGGTETIEIPTPEVGSRAVWEVVVVGWDVKYKEEFVPTEQASYAVIIQRERRMEAEETAVRNSFTNKEPGKILVVIESGMFKKKRVLFRYKVSPPVASS